MFFVVEHNLRLVAFSRLIVCDAFLMWKKKDFLLPLTEEQLETQHIKNWPPQLSFRRSSSSESNAFHFKIVWRLKSIYLFGHTHCFFHWCRRVQRIGLQTFARPQYVNSIVKANKAKSQKFHLEKRSALFQTSFWAHHFIQTLLDWHVK